MHITIQAICGYCSYCSYCSYYNIISDFQKMLIYMYSIVQYCFPFFRILRILRGTRRTDLFVEVTNLMKDDTVWTPFTLTGYYSTSIRLLRQILKEKVHIDTSCCCFKTMHTDRNNTVVTDISGIKIEMPTEAKVSIFTDKDLKHINDDHFEINLVASLLNQIYVVPTSPP